MVDSIRTRHRK